MTTLNPYKQTGSVASKTFELAKAGTSKDALIAFFAENQVGPARLLRELRLEAFRGITWKYAETEDGSIQITDVAAEGEAPATPKAKLAKAVIAANTASAAKSIAKASAKADNKAAEMDRINKAIAPDPNGIAGLNVKLIPAKCTWFGYKRTGLDSHKAIIGTVFVKNSKGKQIAIGSGKLRESIRLAASYQAQFEEIK